jgi:hypothetical protein
MCRFELTCRSIRAVLRVRRPRRSPSSSRSGCVAFLRARYDCQSKKPCIYSTSESPVCVLYSYLYYDSIVKSRVTSELCSEFLRQRTTSQRA